MLSQDESKKQISILIEKFKQAISNGDLNKNTSEEDIKIKFILPLFEALNWDFKDVKEIKAESRVFKKRVDLAFSINQNIKFLVEIKKLIAITDENVEQAYNYGYIKGVRWVVLTNFESFYIIDCFTKQLNQRIWKIFHSSDYVKEDVFQYINLFNQSGFLDKEKSLIDEFSDRHRTAIFRKNVAELIFEQLIKWRGELTNDIRSHPILNKIRNDEDLDEAVQLFINRLIFIRYCEDRHIEENQRLKYELNKWESNRKKKLIEHVRDLFIDFDNRYDSSLFRPRIYFDIAISDDLLKNIINGLYYNRNSSAFFDFALIDADVLGNIYEEYLEHLLKTAKGRKKTKLKRKHQHRKEFGQYYTPSSIVDFIVKNTLESYLSNKSLEDIKELKVLDCACGSGSFLIKAFDILKKFYDKRGIDDGFEILKNHLFGVDVDKKACEIAKLNLLLRSVRQPQFLPDLNENIKNGNSLISTDAEHFFLKAFKLQKPFNWNEEFKFNFDVIIGNPPYVEARSLSQDEVDYFRANYKTSGNRINTFTLFIEKSINLLKDEGLLGMIIHKNSIRSNDYIKMRKFILDTCKIIKVIMLGAGIFKEVTGEMVILILQKEKDKNKRLNNITLHGDLEALHNQNYTYTQINQRIFYKIPDNRINIYLNNKKIEILEKIKRNSILLNKIADTKQGIIVGNEKRYIKDKQISKKYKPILRGRDIDKYQLEFKNKYLYYVAGTKVLKRGKTPDLFEKKEKIVTQHVSSRIIAALDTEGYYTLQTINLVYSTNQDYPNKYILALLNSKLLNFYYDCYFNMGSEFTTAVATENLNTLPMKLGKNKDEIISLVNENLSLNKELLKEKNKYSTKYLKLKEQIEKIEDKIDNLIYELYEVKEYKEVIEKSLK